MEDADVLVKHNSDPASQGPRVVALDDEVRYTRHHLFVRKWAALITFRRRHSSGCGTVGLRNDPILSPYAEILLTSELGGGAKFSSAPRSMTKRPPDIVPQCSIPYASGRLHGMVYGSVCMRRSTLYIHLLM